MAKYTYLPTYLEEKSADQGEFPRGGISPT